MGGMFRSVMRWLFACLGIIGALLFWFSAPVHPWPLVGTGLILTSIFGLLAFRK